MWEFLKEPNQIYREENYNVEKPNQTKKIKAKQNSTEGN